MIYEIIITIVVTILALVLFATSRIGVDVIAVGIMVVLVITDVLSAEKAVKGFANTATLTVAAMFVLSDALIKTGVIGKIATLFSTILSKGYSTGVATLSAIVGVISAFINNTPVVATFIPVISKAARDSNKAPAKYLIPLSYGAIFGGTCTLIGTSTNLLVSGIAQDHGVQGFEMFTLAPLGIVFFVSGTLYMMFFGRKFIPNRMNDNENERAESINNFLCEIVIAKVREDEKTIRGIFKDEEVLLLKTEEEKFEDPNLDTELHEGDILLIKGNLKVIQELLKNEEITIREYGYEKQFPEEQTELMEIVIPANSLLEGKSLNEIDFLKKYNAGVLAIRQRGKEKFIDLENVRLQSGDVILIETNQKGSELIGHQEDAQQAPFLSMSSQSIQHINRQKLAIVLTTLFTVILLASFDLVPIMIGALGGIVVLTITRVITMPEAYQAIDWKVIFLLAGTLSLGAAMSASGLTSMIGDFFKEEVGQAYHPVIVVAVLYAIASVLTEIISNNATAALLTPLIIELTADVDINLTPLLLTLAFACSSSFMTPVSYQTNTMVYSAGTYRYADFIKVGFPLKIIFWILASLLIPAFYTL